MGVLVFVLGRSGTGKSYSMRNFEKDKLGVVNVQGKILPFKGSGSIDSINTDQSDKIVSAVKKHAQKYKSIVVDDYQYVMANEFMRRAAERGFDKFTEIARHAWDIADCVKDLPGDVIVYVMCHTDTDAEGTERLKTIGKLLDEKICLEGMSTIVLKTNVSDGQYTFLTQNNGKDTVKSPAGMFPSYAIDNDLKYVDDKIRNYYELGEFLSDEEMKEIDAAAKKDDVPIAGGDKKRRTRKSANAPAENAENTDAAENVESAENVETPAADETPENLPKRKRRTAVTEDNDTVDTSVPPTTDAPPAEAETETADATPPRRRRRRVTGDE